MQAFRGLMIIWALMPAGVRGLWTEPAVALKAGKGNPTVVLVEIADTPAEWTRGLMDRWQLPENRGMLFVYPAQQMLSYWMKNTPIYLDMIFADRTGKIVSIHERAEPFSEKSISSRAPAVFVLEVNGGMARKWGIKPGDKMLFGPLTGVRAH